MNRRELFVVFFSVVPGLFLVFFNLYLLMLGVWKMNLPSWLVFQGVEGLHIFFCTTCLCNFHQKQEMFIQVLRGGTVAVVLGNFKQTV